jgi:hypothetical protein
MNSLRKLAPAMSLRIVAALACVTLAASPGAAAARHAPHHAGPPAPQGGGQGASTPVQAKPEGGEATSPVDATTTKATAKEPADRGKSTDSKSVGPIDLTRPDDGYANLRRRAARTSLITAQKKLPAVTPATLAAHSAAAATAEHTRNAAGAAVPVAPTLPTAVGAARPEPVHAAPTAFGAAKNSLGLGAGAVHPAPVHVATTPAPPKPPVGGVNGTSLHQAGPGIGGPAKDHSAIAGSSYKHK